MPGEQHKPEALLANGAEGHGFESSQGKDFSSLQSNGRQRTTLGDSSLSDACHNVYMYNAYSDLVRIVSMFHV